MFLKNLILQIQAGSKQILEEKVKIVDYDDGGLEVICAEKLLLFK